MPTIPKIPGTTRFPTPEEVGALAEDSYPPATPAEKIAKDQRLAADIAAGLAPFWTPKGPKP